MNFYHFNIGDYAGKTRHLSWDEDMAYRRLLDVYYASEAPLPADRKKIYRLAGAQTAKQKQAVDTVLEEFFEEVGDGWHNSRCNEEILKAADKRGKAQHSAMLSVAARSAKSLRSERMAAAREKGTHTKDEWVALVDICGNQCVRCGAVGHLDRDHIKPVYQGGSDGIENIQPLCARCNASKGPEDKDHRPANWQQMLNERLSERSTNAQRSLNERSAPSPSPSPSPNIDGIGLRARQLDETLEHTLRKAAGWAAHPAPKLAVTGPIQALLDSGADLELDVLPVIRALAHKVRSPSWGYFVNPIAEARDQRIAAATVVSMPSPASRTSHAEARRKPSRDETFAAIDRRIEQLAEAERRAAGGGTDLAEEPAQGKA